MQGGRASYRGGRAACKGVLHRLRRFFKKYQWCETYFLMGHPYRLRGLAHTYRLRGSRAAYKGGVPLTGEGGVLLLP